MGQVEHLFGLYEQMMVPLAVQRKRRERGVTLCRPS